MNHLIIAPVLLPAVVGALIALWMRGDLLLQRVFSTAATAVLVGVAIWLNWLAWDGTITVYRLGNWQAPFGIVLLLDRLAALMVLLTAGLGLIVQLYAIGSQWDTRGQHFHALWQFQLMGVCGAFLTGDAFNLFVFFEVLLIASYGLMVHAGGTMRLKAGLQYVVYNLAGSALFLAALGTIYAVTGTLNMTDIGVRVAQMGPEGSALLNVGAVLLILVFAVKAALVPLHFWLPATYANAPGPVAALFAIMTKVGVYGIIRFTTLAFPAATPVGALILEILLPAALVTLVLGQLGVFGARNLGRMAAFAAIGSIGTLMIAVALPSTGATSAAIYYMVHSTLAAGALFLILDLIERRRGTDWLVPTRAIAGAGLIAAFYFAIAIGVTGMPPLSGFIGKLLVMWSAADMPARTMVWTLILVTSLIAITGMVRAGILVFWKAQAIGPAAPARPEPLSLTAIAALLTGLIALTIFAGPIITHADATAAQLHQAEAYVEAVLMQQEGAK